MISLVGIKQKLFLAVEIVHLRIFGHEIGGEMILFLKNLNYTFVATIIVGILIYTLNILAGRWLSIEDYGRYQLILSMSFFLIIPLLMGLTTSSIHAIAKNYDPKEVVSSVLLLVVHFSLVFILLMFLFSKELASLFGVDNYVMVTAIVYSAFFSLYSIFRSFLQGFLKFQKIAIFETIYAASTFCLFLMIISFFGIKDFRLPIIAFDFGYLIFGILCVPFLWNYFSVAAFSRKTSKILLQNGFVMVAASVSGFLLGNIDKFIINRTIDIKAVAIYSAYFYSAGIFMNIFLQTFITVFFPSITQVIDFHKKTIDKKINKLFVFSWPFLVLFSFLFMSISFYLFGEKYNFNYLLAALFSIYVSLQFFISIKQWLLASFNEKGMVYSTYSTVVASLVNIVMVYFFTLYYGLMGAVSGLIISLVLFIFINRYFLTLLFRENIKI